MSVFRASRPANQSPRKWAMDWGVYDSRSGEMVTAERYTEAFARALASAMNWAYQQGRRDRGS